MSKSTTPTVSRRRLRGLEFDELLRGGETAAKSQRWGPAELYFKEVVRRRPSHFLANLLLGRLLSKRAPRTAYRHLETARRINPRSQAVHFSLGEVLQSMGRNSAAADSYRKVIFLNPRHYEANKRLHLLLRRLRQGKTVVQRAAESFEANPSLATLTLFGRIVMEQSTPRQALLEFDLLIRRHPELPEIHLWRARARRKSGDRWGELEAYQSFLIRRPKAHAVRLLLIERFNDQGRYSRAETLVIPFGLNKARQDQDLSPEVRGRYFFLHSRLLARRKKPASAARGLLLAYRFMKKREPIERAFSGFLASFPGSEGLWEAYGDWMRLTGRPAKAAAAWLQAARLDSSRVPRALGRLAEMNVPKAGEAVALALAELYAARGDYQQALALLNRAPLGYPIKPGHALLRGRIHFKTGNFETALDDFLQYLMSYTSNLDILHARGNLFWEMGRQQKALRAWLQNPEVLTRHPIGLLKVAGIYRKRGEASRERAVRERLTQLLPGNVVNRIRLGDLYLAQGRHLDALNQWKDLVAERPGDKSLLLKIGRIWVSLDNPAQAVSYLEKAARLGKLDLKSTELYGAYLYRTGRFGEALEQYRHLYSLRPQHPALPTVLPELVTKLPAAETLRMAAARMAIKAGRREPAVLVLKRVIGENPKNQQARMLLAKMHLRAKRADQAVSVLMAGGGATRNSPPAMELLARAQEAAGQLEPLAGTLELIQSRRPKDFRLARRRASLLSRLGRNHEARFILEAIWKADRSAVDVIFSLVRVEVKMGLPDAEEKRMVELLAHHPTHEPAQRRLIKLWVRAGKWEALLPKLSSWVRGHPRDAIARYNLIVAHLRRRDTQGARPHFEALKKINPRYSSRLESYFR
ncbi:MAG: tetratricopeptide repeat protein [bacterium]